MATHRCSIYVRSNGGNRDRLPAYPNTAYEPGTIFQLRYKQGNRRVWRTLDVANYNEALIAAKAQELELFRQALSLPRRNSSSTG
jgi:hypothetical protein